MRQGGKISGDGARITDRGAWGWYPGRAPARAYVRGGGRPMSDNLRYDMRQSHVTHCYHTADHSQRAPITDIDTKAGWGDSTYDEHVGPVGR